ncbi:MAG: hypothetical protein IPJ65_23440 [Archangiaceae bacterium]|nr:hypothetical protein [Archangiaceae bacterium]
MRKADRTLPIVNVAASQLKSATAQLPVVNVAASPAKDAKLPVVNVAESPAKSGDATLPVVNVAESQAKTSPGHTAASTGNFSPPANLSPPQQLALQLAHMALNNGAAISPEHLDALPGDVQAMLLQEQTKVLARKTEALLTGAATQLGRGSVGY